MKRIFAIFSCAVFAVSCTKTSSTEEVIKPEETIGAPAALRACASEEVLAANLLADPGLAARMAAIEEVTDRFAANGGAQNYTSNGIVYIPVVVNVLYKTAAENVSQAQIQSQIDVLNADFSGTNSDISQVPAVFTGVKAGDVGVRFVLDQVIRKATTKTSWRTDDAMKKSSRGGIDPTSPSTKMNMWACTMGGGILGYAQFPGGSLATDGIVITNTAFGVTTAGAPYNKGRTGTHEVGHYLNLRHIWGDATCGNDFVGDTPLHNGANYGCPVANKTSTCSGNPVMQTMNYMDYTDDLCMYMFSAGQKTRLNATFAAGGGRTSLAL